MKIIQTIRRILLFTLALATFFITGCDEIKDIIDPETEPDVIVGDTLWVYELQDLHLSANPLAIGPDGTIYTSAGGHGWNGTDWRPERILALNKSDGTLKWQSEELEWSQINSNIVVGDDGTVFVNSGHKLYSIDPSTGNFNWVWEVPQTLPGENGTDVYTYGALGQIALAADGDIVTITSESGSYYRAVYKIKAGSGVTSWHRFTSASTAGNYITVGKNGTIFKFDIIDPNYVIIALNPQNGILKWSINAYSSSSANNISIADNGDLITFVQTDTLARINYSNGQFVWKQNVSSWNAAKFIDNHGNILTYNQWSGSALYSVSDGSLVNGPLSLPRNVSIDDKNQLYGVISDYDPHLSVTDEDGTVKWGSSMGIYGGSIAVSNDKIVYFTIDNKLFALQGDGALSHSGWPRFTHDNRNTFNANKF
ncbi:MAG: PQQ-like beta-propeller repeat protein [Chlorobi bacterium]|nr:PQQ-like beta-propeller repeat protein [Chlorobiota bacterium]